MSTEPHVFYTNQWRELSKIHQSRYNLAIFQRRVSPVLNTFLDLLQHVPDVPTIQETLPLYKLNSLLRQHLSIFQTLHTQGYQEFMQDIYQISTQFCQLTQANKFKIYFAKINDSMCRLFHTDANELRLLCTYRGAGTQWVSNHNIHQDLFNSTSNRDRIRDLSKVFEIETSSIAILKGALHDNIATTAVVHRSPPLTKGKSRLLLRLDMENTW